jgi:Asp-tRNA(Asn)/Glu-tRNA(Gln) amidotransferase A subunit family amidase
MVGKQSMEAMLDLAVSRALEAEMGDLGREKKRALQQKVRAQFKELLGQNARTVKGVSKGRFLTEMDSARQEILKRRNQAEAEMGELERRAAMLNSLQSAGPMEAARSAAFEARLERRFRELESASSKDSSDMYFLAELANTAAGMARDEWDSMLVECAASATQEIDNYRRRIAKLSSALEETEEALDDMSKLAEGDPGVASIYRRVRGLQDEEGPVVVLKRRLLTEIFKSNVELQDLKQSS